MEGDSPSLVHLVSFHHSLVAACSDDVQLDLQRGGACEEPRQVLCFCVHREGSRRKTDAELQGRQHIFNTRRVVVRKSVITWTLSLC